MSLEESIKKLIVEEVKNRQPVNNLQPLAEFCKSKNISRTTVWRAEKEGKIKLTRPFGRKVFVNLSQFAV